MRIFCVTKPGLFVIKLSQYSTFALFVIRAVAYMFFFSFVNYAACPSGFYGYLCREKCLCKNGAACNHVTGKCTCKPGYTGTTCDTST